MRRAVVLILARDGRRRWYRTQDIPSVWLASIIQTHHLSAAWVKEVKRRADVVGIFSNEASITRLVGAVLLAANDDWRLHHRYT